MNCHQGGDTRILQPGKEYSDFRPGTPLCQTLAILRIPIARGEASSFGPARAPFLNALEQMLSRKWWPPGLPDLPSNSCESGIGSGRLSGALPHLPFGDELRVADAEAPWRRR